MGENDLAKHASAPGGGKGVMGPRGEENAIKGQNGWEGLGPAPPQLVSFTM